MEHDSAMLSESVYASCLMLSFAGLMIGLRARQISWLASASAAMALAILTRPAGMFLIVTYLLVLAWLFATGPPPPTLIITCVDRSAFVGVANAHHYLIRQMRPLPAR